MTKYRKAILDGDTLLYIEALKAQDGSFKYDPEFEVEFDLDQIMQNILDSIQTILFNTKCTRYSIYLTGSKNFRYSILPSYKWRRTNTIKPVILDTLKQMMIEKHKAILVDGLEADDLCIMDMSNVEDEVTKVICHIDKDLNQVSGLHYNYKTKKLYEVSEEEAHRYLITQVLTGDTSDCYLGCPKVGDTKVPSIIESSYMIRPEIKEYSKGKRKGEKEIVWQTYFDPSKSLEEVILSWFIYGGATKGFIGHKLGFDTTSGYQNDIQIVPVIKKNSVVISKSDLDFVKNEMNIQYTIARMLRHGDVIPKKPLKFIS